MSKKKNDLLEKKLLSTKEIDEQISLLRKQKMLALKGKVKPKEIVRIYEFESLSEAEVFDYKTFYEVTDIKNNTAYYLNGVQVAALFGMNEEYKRQFAAKNTQGEAQIDDKLVSFYYREIK